MTNTISSANLQNFQPLDSTGTTTSDPTNANIMQMLQQLLGTLQQYFSGLGGTSTTGGSTSGNSTGSNSSGGGTSYSTGQPASGTLGSTSGPGTGLTDVKINSTAGGDALHLQEDGQGNLYNASGDSVGVISPDGTVTFNSGATKEISQLENGGNPLAANTVTPTTGDGGNVSFSPTQVTVSAPDLNQQNNF
jgi:hypothetical protein